jgi:tight adherence protein B
VGAVLGLGVGVGLVLVWLALTSPVPSTARPDRVGRTRDLLDRAGLPGTTVGGVWSVCAIGAVVVFVAVQVVSHTATVAAAFGLMAGYLPFATLAGRARRRQRELAEVWPEAVDNLASAVRAGMSLPEALTALGHRGP